ncbi:MAG TPA: hypothetical protein VJK02_07425 [Anaerolineales bacterium]|nr:hypothetical protein [Anaerolineales bacterium]
MRRREHWFPVVAFAAAFAAVLACGPFPSLTEPTAVGSVIPGTRVLTQDRAYYESPAWSPDGRYVAIFRNYRVSGDFIYADTFETGPVLIDLESGDHLKIPLPSSLKEGASSGPAMWLAEGRELAFYHIDFVDGRPVPLIVRYDLESQRTEASEVCCAPLSLEAGGSEVLVNSSSDDSFGLGWLDLETGQVVHELSLPRDEPRQHQYRDISLSPDARTLLLGAADGVIYRYAIGSGEPPVPFVSSAASPAWSPDGSKVVYVSLPANGDYYNGQLMIANADGSSPEPLFSEPQPRGMLSPAWSPDGTQMAFLYGTEHSNRLLVVEIPERLRPTGAFPAPPSKALQ